ncbi:DNA-binding transcriptional regulator, LysR family [Alteromonadaceae bacterium Bs31]|nr:DNA-binding transcriptional regulator, LysR family [Alteromonadaceae bacterium Bs31]
MKYTLRQLQVFLAVAHHQNVSRAADELAMSQSSVSGALKDLETQFDIQLFDRIGKRLQINELGLRLRSKAEALLAEAQELESEFTRHTLVGELKVGATLTIGNYLCVSLINQYMQQGSQARVQLEVANTSTIAQQILDFKIDIGMIEGELQHPDLLILPWREDELVCFCAPAHPYAGLDTLSDKQLQAASWILREQGSGTRQTFDRAAGSRLHSLNIALELQHTEAIKRAVEQGLGISCLSSIALKDAFDRGTLVPLLTPQLPLGRNLYLVLHRHKYRSEGIRSWLAICNRS